jgi:uncharacterized protein YjbI with pentapeptide repeats
VRLEDVDLARAELVNVDLSGATFQNVDLRGAKLREVMLVDARMSGLIDGLVVNDVEVAPLIVAELDRRYPERRRLRPDDAAGVRDAWTVVEALWATTKARAAALPEPLLHERVDGEWSLLETLRHLVFVTDTWISDRVLGRHGHHHPFGMPPSFVRDPERLGIDLTVDPAFAEVVAAREDRLAVVADLIGTVTDDELRRPCGGEDGITVLTCLRTVFDEEWHHTWYANRDLDALAPP